MTELWPGGIRGVFSGGNTLNTRVTAASAKNTVQSLRVAEGIFKFPHAFLLCLGVELICCIYLEYGNKTKKSITH